VTTVGAPVVQRDFAHTSSDSGALGLACDLPHLGVTLVQRLANALANALGQVFPNDVREATLNGVRHMLGIESPAQQALLDERCAKGTGEVPP